MVLKAEMQSREAESSNFYSSPLIQAEKDKKVVNLRHSCPVTQAEGAKTFVTGVYSIMVEHDRVVPMIEQIDQIMDALLDHERDRGTPMQCRNGAVRPS